MEMLITKIQTEPQFDFSELFPGKCSLKLLVVTFIAILELTRLKRLKIRQNKAFSDFVVTRVDEAASEEDPESPDEKELEPSFI
jgi:segregation and condensation protein A